MENSTKAHAKTEALFGVRLFDKEQQELDVKRANGMIKAYKDDVSPGKPIFIDEKTLKKVKAFAIEEEALAKIRTLPDYTGIRLYLAVRGFTSPDRKPIYTLIIVPKGKEHQADKDKNILEDNFLYDWVEPCPDNCPDEPTQIGEVDMP
jgi:hypothetical protein